jgi:tetratricopeptide (TPR) repeat protein
MKPGRTRSQRFPGAGGSPPKEGTPSPIERMPAPQSRRWWFRALALLSPILLLGLGELGLRVAGYGYAASFFLENHHEGRTLLIENPKFGWRFFPPSLARSPQPLSLAAAKPPGTIRIFVLGESAAMGDPEPAYGFPRQLERILQARDPNHKFEVVNVAMTAINSHVIREIARDCARRQGDFWVVYMGNNEVVGPFGAGTIFGRQTPGLAFVRASLLVKSTRLGQCLGAWRARSAGRSEWQGMEMFLRNQVRSDAPSLRIVYEHFARNLAAMVELGRNSGATVLVATVPVNLRDSPPFASLHRQGLSDGQLEEWDKCFGRGRQAQDAGQFAAALAAYREAGQIDAEFAELAFRRAVCELTLAQTNAASPDFLLARDLDTLRFRADSHLNQTIRQVAAAQGVALIDAEQECARRSADGIPGAAFFYDHVHLNFTGNYLVASLFAAEIEKNLTGVASSSGASMPGEADVARQLALTDFDHRRIGEEMRLRLQQPPFASQLNARARDEEWQGTLARLQAPLAQFTREYQAAVGLAPEDWVLRANYARLLEAAGDATAAAAQWQTVARLLPHEPDAWFQLGDLAYSARSFSQAQDLFREALKRKRDCLEALNGLGLALAAQDQAEAAMREFKAALRLDRYYSAARVNLAVALANRGEIPAAMAEYRTVLQLETNNVAARINLAKLLARQGNADQAIILFKEALALKPDEPVANFDLANALVAQGRQTEAVPHYEAAVRVKPEFAEARFNLAMECARGGNLTEALAQFAEVVRLQPDFVSARFNYGIALARQQRYAEAAQQFQETLQRQPDHSAAKSALERALQLAKGQRQGQP